MKHIKVYEDFVNESKVTITKLNPTTFKLEVDSKFGQTTLTAGSEKEAVEMKSKIEKAFKDGKINAIGGIGAAVYEVSAEYSRKNNKESLNEFGPLAGSGNTRANDLDNIKREAAKKSERGETVYVVGGKHGSYKLSKYFEKENTYAAYHNGIPTPVDESLVDENN